MTTSHWLSTAVAAIAQSPLPEMPPIYRQPPLLPGIDLWDYWPVQERNGRVAQICGGTLYMLLSAAAEADPEDRHAKARIRLMHRTAAGWKDLGPAFPDGFAPGSRQWSGSAVVDAGHTRLTLYFTAAGSRGEHALGFEQRMFVTEAELGGSSLPVVGAWSTPVEIVAADGEVYMREMSGGGAIGTIKAFRDPWFFCDPHDGAEYLLFSCSLAGSTSAWNGAIGVAIAEGCQWTLGPPLIDADGVNNELERPHIVIHDGRYYCFWSTQAKVFAEGGPSGPTGLYGMVADAFAGPWRPLNGSGLVLANPAAFPHQAYSWLVQDDLKVLSFIDYPELSSPPADVAEARRHFGGTPAPDLQLRLDGDRAGLA
jgi:levansucrase